MTKPAGRLSKRSLTKTLMKEIKSSWKAFGMSSIALLNLVPSTQVQHSMILMRIQLSENELEQKYRVLYLANDKVLKYSSEKVDNRIGRGRSSSA
jgi:hypothetical protein